MFQLTSRVLFIRPIPHESAIEQITLAHALPQQRNVQERQFAIQKEHARVNMTNTVNVNHDLENERLAVFYQFFILSSNIKFVINPIFFFLIYQQILLITIRQQSNPQKIINVAPGKLLLDCCIYAIPSSKKMATRSTTLSLFITFQEYRFQGHVLVHMAKVTIQYHRNIPKNMRITLIADG